jgi:hypothetical protein
MLLKKLLPRLSHPLLLLRLLFLNPSIPKRRYLDLELTIHKGEEPVQDVSLLETREDLPEGQDASPSVVAFNKSFGTSHRG